MLVYYYFQFENYALVKYIEVCETSPKAVIRLAIDDWDYAIGDWK